MKRKYLHIQLINGDLFIYADDTAWRKEKIVSLQDMDNECLMQENIDNKTSVCFRIPLKDFK